MLGPGYGDHQHLNFLMYNGESHTISRTGNVTRRISRTGNNHPRQESIRQSTESGPLPGSGHQSVAPCSRTRMQTRDSASRGQRRTTMMPTARSGVTSHSRSPAQGHCHDSHPNTAAGRRPGPGPAPGPGRLGRRASGSADKSCNLTATVRDSDSDHWHVMSPAGRRRVMRRCRRCRNCLSIVVVAKI